MSAPGTYQCAYRGAAIIESTSSYKAKIQPNDDEGYHEENTTEMNVTAIQMNGRQDHVIIDNFAFLNSQRNQTSSEGLPPLGKKISSTDTDCGICYACVRNPLNRWETEVTRDPKEANKRFADNEERLLYLPPKLLGFALERKQWCQFLVDNISRPARTEEHMKPFWEELQLKKSNKELLVALVKYHRSSTRHGSDDTNVPDAKTFDVVEGKGQGLIILLHGPPGVGKTLTAETIALATDRPLLAVAVADIGVEPEAAEANFQDIFDDAARWEAVLLVDEADIFVEERKQGNLERNALVSVLLCCLEVYDGIITLTTNRVRAIDAAVQSRVNLAIQYHDLTPEQRLNIYRNRLKWVPDDEIGDRAALDRALLSSPVTKFGNKSNGRQIRNTVNGARALARSQGVGLMVDHIETVEENTSNFTQSMSLLLQIQRARNEVD